MGFEIWNHTTISILITLVVFFVIFYLYSDKIENYVLRNVILAATRLVLVTQDTSDYIHQLAWKKIIELIEQMDANDKPMPVEKMFIILNEMLKTELEVLTGNENSRVEMRTIQKAISCVSVWRFVVYNEIVNGKPVNIAPRRFIRVIKANID